MKWAYVILGLSLVLTGCDSSKQKQSVKEYQPNWSSLSRHEIPQWLQDAKFGIYTHVSFDTIRNLPGNENKWSHELIDDFTLENFDAAEWADLFQRAGAKFAGPVALHGSGFLHWDSDLTQFDTVDMGPKFDLTGLLKPEIEARGMKFMMSFHTTNWYGMGVWNNPEIKNPKYKDLYGPVHDEDLVIKPEDRKYRYELQSKMSREHADSWLARVNEAVDKYQPDLTWFDLSFGGTLRALNWGRLKDGKLMHGEDPDRVRFGSKIDHDIYLFGLPEQTQREFLAHFFNSGLKRGQEVEFVYKAHDVPVGVGMRNIENGLISELAYDTWMTDIDMCLPVSWFYKEGMGIRDANNIIDMLIDVTSRNGIFLLNVPPKADGTFADELVKELDEVGSWLEINGEAIYNTIPWIIYGEGPSVLKETGHYSEGQVNAIYTENDFRYTQKDHTLYAVCLGVPEGEVTIEALGSRGRLFEGDILSLELLGSDDEIQWQQNSLNLTLQMPKNFKASHACVFKIERRP